MEVWKRPYQTGRVWQSFDIARELERVHGVPWATELSPMSGGRSPAPFVQEFPLAQYGVWLLRSATGMSVPGAGQAIALLIAAASAAVWLVYARSLPVEIAQRIGAGALLFFLPGFLRYGTTAVPDALVFLFNLTGAALIFFGRRTSRNGIVTIGAVVIGAAVLVKATTFLAAGVIALALVAEKRWRPAIALCAATLPGLVWAAMARSINKASLPVNEFARVGNLREYWWDPRLYLNPWWYRSLGFTLYDVLGLLGLAGIAFALVGSRRSDDRFELAVLFGPAAITGLAFPYHTATHGYYSLTWLAFPLVAGMECLTKRRAWSGPVLAMAIALGIGGVMERQMGLVERIVARRPEAVTPLFHLHPPEPTPRDVLARSALLDAAKSASLIAYLGSDGSVFLQSGFRGWVVEAPDADPRLAPRQHLPDSVVREEEWQKLSPAWFLDRVARGLDAVLIERGGPLNRPDVLQWAKAAGLAAAPDAPSGYILLSRGR